MLHLFRPILAGASLRDRMVGSLGGLLGILTTALLAALTLGRGTTPFLVAPMGASAVLVFAVPASPLAQPWPVIGGNVVSALIGIPAARFVPGLALASGVAVGGAIMAMSLLRCLHPPGGAAALTAVIGGPAVASAGYAFAIAPVAVDAAILTAAGLIFHLVTGHAYPHRPARQPLTALHRDDIDRALADLSETFDVAPEDLATLLDRAEHHARRRPR